MGMMEDFEVSLQVLRGFDTDISLEVNEIKVKIYVIQCPSCTMPAFAFKETFGLLLQATCFQAVVYSVF